MVKKTENTEERIIAAAKLVFIQKGLDGARMQEIADQAEINKSLLHYYFRSKDKLFNRVFSESFVQVIQTINEVFDTFNDIDSLIEAFVRNYISLLKNNPHIPHFILHELNRKPERIVEQIRRSNFDRSRVFDLISKDADSARLKPFDPVHIVVNIIALCVFPFVAQPILQGFLFNGDEAAFQEFIDQRTQHIISFLKSAIFINHSDK